MTRQERRQARIERYRNFAANARQQSNELFQRSNDMAFIIPCGQPVHGAADRKYRDRIWETMGRSVKIERKADYFDRKAEAAENNNAIYLEDDDSIQRLEAKIKRLNGLQEKMKAANKILRNKKLTEAEKIVQLKELGFSEKDAASCLIPDYMGEIGFPSWQLSNNNAVIRNAKQRLEKAIRLKTTESKEYEINGVRVVENTEENRLQLFFDGKPEQDVIMNLKYNGFRWAPSQGCWQSYLNRYKIERKVYCRKEAANNRLFLWVQSRCFLYLRIKAMSELKYDPRNYRIHTDKNKRLIRKSLEDCGAGRSILFDKDDCIIAGNGVYEQAQALGLPVRVIESDGTELIAIKRTDLSTEDTRRKALALADNYTSDTSVFDFDAIVEDFGAEELDAWEFDVGDLSLDEVSIDEEKSGRGRKGCLKDRFIIPPFSVLDARSGNWQDRKRAWLELGIKSDDGRGDCITYKRSSQPPAVYEARNEFREKTGIDPSWDELQEYCQEHGITFIGSTSIFDPVLCELAYRWFNVSGGLVLDPFAGGSVRGIVAARLGMPYIGIDLRAEQIEANIRNATEVLGKDFLSWPGSPLWKCGDSLHIDEMVSEPADLVFSCPPYADLEVYSDNPADLSTMDYGEFLTAYRTIIKKCCDRLKENRFAVFVVGEVRDKEGAYRNFVSDTILAFQQAGLQYYDEMILVTMAGSLAMRAGKQFSNSRKIGKQHQNVLVFYKGDLRKIRDNFPELDFSDDDLFKEE